ncbi:ATP-binding cassette domain-containing protein, partial [Acinetobacter baumannii]
DREAELAEQALGIARRLRLDHVIDNPVTALSGGPKKLVEIGRALMAAPKRILLDEPMAGVNPSLTEEIASHLVALNREGITICLI